MKFIITALLLCFALSINSQTDAISGTYTHTIGKDSAHSIEYTLTLNTDGTFKFHSYSNAIKSIPPEVHTYGKGLWKADKNLIRFYTDVKNDMDKEYTLDFNNTKARYSTKSPRDTSDRDIKTQLQIYNSEIFWLRGTELIKH